MTRVPLPPATALLAPGTTAPDFALQDQTGREVTLRQFRNQAPVVLFFYPKDGTAGCSAQNCGFRDHFDELVGHGAEVIGVSSDTVASHRAFAERLRLPFTLLSDPDQMVRVAYGVPRTLGLIPGRVTFVIDQQGVIRAVFNSQFRPAAHVSRALSALSTLPRD